MSRLGQINRVKHCFDNRTLIIIINALVFSKLFYCSSVWSSTCTSQSNIPKLQAVQNFACRIVSGSKKYDQVTPILRQPWNNTCIIAIQLWHLNAWMALLRGIYLISSLNVHQYQHAKLETHSCYIYHCLIPQLAKEHFTIVWSLSGTLYIVPQYIKLSQSLAHFKGALSRYLATL